MALLGKYGVLATKFRQAAAFIKNEPPVSALEAYESSDLKRCIDAIAEITGATRDENGSFDVTYTATKEEAPFVKSDDQARFHFVRKTEGDVKGIAFNFEAQRIVTENAPVQYGSCTHTLTSKGSGKYNFAGDNINFLKINVPLVGKLNMMPDDNLPSLLSALAKAAPGLLAEITRCTGLEGPPPEPEQDPLQVLFAELPHLRLK